MLYVRQKCGGRSSITCAHSRAKPPACAKSNKFFRFSTIPACVPYVSGRRWTQARGPQVDSSEDRSLSCRGETPSSETPALYPEIRKTRVGLRGATDCRSG